MKALKMLGLATLFAMTLIACKGNEPSDPTNPDPVNPEPPAPPLTEFACLNGSDYHVLIMDGVTFPRIEKKVVNDLRVNDTDMFLYIWDNTYLPGTAAGPNFFQETEGWPCLMVGSAGWSGAGFCLAERTADLSTITNDYVLHIALKSKQAKSSYLFLLNNKSKVCIGSDAFVDGNETFQPFANFTRDGEWNEIEIPMSKFLSQYPLRDPITSDNIVTILSGGVEGTTLDIDALFIYKPAAK